MNRILFGILCWVGLVNVQAEFINFDDRPASNYAGNIYSPQGVSISTTFFPGVASVGNIITVPPLSSSISLVTFPQAFYASPPNGLFPENMAEDADLFFQFSTPVTSLSFYTDYVPETADTITLLGLADAGGGQYLVVDRFDYDDSGTNLAQSFVSRDYTATPITAFAWIAPMADSESIDDLNFTPVPEPGILSLLVLGGLGLAARFKKFSWKKV